MPTTSLPERMILRRSKSCRREKKLGFFLRLCNSQSSAGACALRLNNHHYTMRFQFLIPAAFILTACQTAPKTAEWDVPLTLKTAGPAYAEYVIERADTNKDGTVTVVEWVNAGGTKRSFAVVDQNKDGVVTRTELVKIGSNARFFDMTRRYADFNKDNKLTPREFRSPSGVRILRIEF